MQTSAMAATARREAKKPRRRSGTGITDPPQFGNASFETAALRPPQDDAGL
jgi:hypothetical protein